MNNQIKNSINEAFPTKTSKVAGVLAIYYVAKKIWKMCILQDLYSFVKDKFSESNNDEC